MHRTSPIEDALDRARDLGRRAVAIASEPEVRSQAQTAGRRATRAARRASGMRWRAAATDRKVRRDLEAALNAIAAIVDQVEPPRRRLRVVRGLAAIGMLGGGALMAKRTLEARREAESRRHASG